MKTAIGLLAVVAALAVRSNAAEKAVTIDEPRTVTVTERSVPLINVCRYQETLVTLPAGEKVMKAFVADTKNWRLESGRDDQASRYLSIKVVEPLTAQTTINVVSDHDVPYTFKLVLNAEHCDSKVSIDADTQLAETIKKTNPWLAPAEAARLKAQVEQARAEALTAAQKAQQQADAYKANYPAQLHFDYRYDAKAAEKLGVRSVFDDGKFTYVKGRFEETPTFYEVKEGKPSLISFDFQNGVYSTARIVNDGYLAVGGNGNGKHQEKLEFHRVQEAN
jgi:type IV secretion system protein VirB9